MNFFNKKAITFKYSKSHKYIKRGICADLLLKVYFLVEILQTKNISKLGVYYFIGSVYQIYFIIKTNDAKMRSINNILKCLFKLEGQKLFNSLSFK